MSNIEKLVHLYHDAMNGCGNGPQKPALGYAWDLLVQIEMWAKGEQKRIERMEKQKRQEAGR